MDPSARAPSSDVLQAVPVPPDTLIAKAFSRVDYSDAYAIAVPDDMDVDAFAQTFWEMRPSWVSKLMDAHDRLAKLVGLKITKPAPGAPSFAVGAKLAGATVLDRAADEIFFGEDDRHLDFRGSLYVSRSPQPGQTRGIVATTVRYNSRAGKLYFGGVRPFHRKIVRAMLERTARHLSEPPRR